MNTIIISVGILLIIFSVLDLKFKQIPSILLTGSLFVIGCISIQNIPFGILSLIFSIFLYESDFIGGIGDIKVIILIGLLIGSIQILCIYAFLIVFLGFAWKIMVKWKFKKMMDFAFIPSLFFVYLTLVLSGLM